MAVIAFLAFMYGIGSRSQGPSESWDTYGIKQICKVKITLLAKDLETLQMCLRHWSSKGSKAPEASDEAPKPPQVPERPEYAKAKLKKAPENSYGPQGPFNP